MKYTFCVIALVLFTRFASAADTWKLYFENDKVKVFYRYTDCHDNVNAINQQKVLFKFINLADKRVEVSFEKNVIYNNLPAKQGDLKRYVVVLAPNATTEADCTTKDEALFIFSKHLDFTGSVLKNFELKDFAVKPVL